MYKISCIFSGGDCPFSIEIDETQTVFDLQKAIKLEQPDLATVLPRKLELYRINLAESDKDFKKKLECKLKDLSKVPRLYASCQLSQYFGSSNPPKGGKVHILIQIAPRESRDLRRCWINIVIILYSSSHYPISSNVLLHRRAMHKRNPREAQVSRASEKGQGMFTMPFC